MRLNPRMQTTGRTFFHGMNCLATGGTIWGRRKIHEFEDGRRFYFPGDKNYPVEWVAKQKQEFEEAGLFTALVEKYGPEFYKLTLKYDLDEAERIYLEQFSRCGSRSGSTARP